MLLKVTKIKFQRLNLIINKRGGGGGSAYTLINYDQDLIY